MEAAGLVRRSRDGEDRRAVRVELTAEGDAAFHRMRAAALTFDEQLRSGLGDEDVDRARELLARLRENVSG
jgi:MarR family transcriptional regulator for hemolysin